MISTEPRLHTGQAAAKPLSLPFPIKVLLTTFLAITAFSLAVVAAFLVLHHSRRVMPPLFQDLVKSYDLLCFQERFRAFGSAGFYTSAGQPFNYPAPVAVLLNLLYKLRRPTHGYDYILFLFEFLSAGLFVRACMRRSMPVVSAGLLAFCMLAFSFPNLLMLYLQNLELLVWIVLSLGVWAWWTGRPWLAAICFGLAGSLKYFPLLFLGLYSFPREWKKVALGLLTFLGSLGVSLVLLGPTVKEASIGLKQQMASFSSHYLYDWHSTESGIDHSIYALLKLVLARTQHLQFLPRILPLYLAAMGALVLLVYFLRIAQLPDLNRLLALSILCVWITPLSHDYTLVNMYPALVGLILYTLDHAAGTRRNHALSAMFACFAVLFAFLPFVQLHGLRYGGQVRCLVLGILFALVLRTRLPGFAASGIDAAGRSRPIDNLASPSIPLVAG